MAVPHSFPESQESFLLTKLHALQEREGSLTRKGLQELAKQESLSVSELFGFVRFFHYFHLEEDSSHCDAICNGPVCALSGLMPDDKKAGASIPCPGLCDQAPAEQHDGRFRSREKGQGGYTLPCTVSREEVLFRYARLPNPQRIQSYQSLGGYQQLARLLAKKQTEEVLNKIEASGLCGRGGAAFPVAAKLKAVRAQAQTPKYVVCNADEGEPATFKDRTILHLEPHLLLEGMAICGHLIGASLGIIYLRYEYPDAVRELHQALDEARESGFLGGPQSGFDVIVVRGAGSYVCGEETALLNSLEGRMPWPRERPPFPTENGLFGKPTAVSNVETIACIPPLLERGPDWFLSLGRGGNAGTKIYSVSGSVMQPGNYELPLGVTARELIMENAGGPTGKGPLKAFTLGGISGGLVGSELLDLPLDYTAAHKEGFFLGSGGVVVLDERCCVVDFVRTCLLFYESESCGKCYPCRIGTIRLREFFDGLTGRGTVSAEVEMEANEIREVMAGTSACGLGTSVPLLLDGLYRFFPEEVDAHLGKGHCPVGVCRL
jgi:NADH:ubiquinone oxidoreductase subunit F (NADH-binding)/NADH:ubiquinone oxidoreductase subunit E